jgi:hypothetical protein
MIEGRDPCGVGAAPASEEECPMMTRNIAFVLAALTAVCATGCGFGDRSGGSIFGGGSGSNAQCSYDDGRYNDGARICRSGRQYRCNDGRWQDSGNDCSQNAGAAASCAFNGRTYAAGKTTCQSGTSYRCEGGAWANRGSACGDAKAPQPRGERSCQYQNTTVASQATVCRQGKTARCENGKWHRVGTTCQ